MTKAKPSKQPPVNQRLRTRKDLLAAAAALIKSGRELSIDEVAKAALVSRATAYRYFSDISDLVIEVGIDESLPEAKQILSDSPTTDLVDRLDRAETVMHDFICKNERQLRLLIAHSVTKAKANGVTSATPARQNRRSDYIKAALEPHAGELDKRSYKKLSEALALIFGPEALIVFQDVLQLGPQRAREIKQWMIKSLVAAAIKESKSKSKR